jgi:hypothetical protein
MHCQYFKIINDDVADNHVPFFVLWGSSGYITNWDFWIEE